MSHQHCAVATLLAAATLAGGPAMQARAVDTDLEADVVTAIWRIQRFDFVYRSPTVYYACGALQEKISAILQALGAHQRIAVDPGCRAGDFVNHAYANVTLAMPVEATESSVLAATTFDAKQRLTARVRKKPLPTATNLHRFPAQWRTVSISDLDGLRLDAGDCDLLHAMRRQIFPTLGIHVNKGARPCLPGRTMTSRPRLVVTALMPAPPTPRIEDAAPEATAGR